MTPRARILHFIRAYIDANGYPPSHEEIKAGAGISTKSLVNYHLERLERAGELSRKRNTPRGIRLTGGTSAAGRRVSAGRGDEG